VVAYLSCFVVDFVHLDLVWFGLVVLGFMWWVGWLYSLLYDIYISIVRHTSY